MSMTETSEGHIGQKELKGISKKSFSRQLLILKIGFSAQDLILFFLG